MSKTKAKRARRESKREGQRKVLAHQRKADKAASSKPFSKSPAKSQTSKSSSLNVPPATKATTQASQKPSLPFGPYDHILLVGEGDFSFTRSLVLGHGCSNITATSLDSADEVHEKYPTFEKTHDELSALAPPVPIHHGIDATKISSYKDLRCKRDDDMADTETGPHTAGKRKPVQGWDIIAFQFPHTGGLSTDVNRQVRVNQSLLASFFTSCLQPSVYKPSHGIHPPFLRLGGCIIITLFEAHPYTLWNVRDLARHTGLKVVTSWAFDWDEYPGYRHVRTLGTIEGGGAWRGEDRRARMYVFEKVREGAVGCDEEERRGEEKGKDGKRKRNESSDEED